MKGECECGQVHVEAARVEARGLNCYCTICRKISGAPFTSVVIVPASAYRVVRGADVLATYRSSPGFTRAHCGRCHAPIHGVITDRDAGVVFANALLFDPAALAGVTFEHMFVRSAVPWVSITDSAPRHATFPEPPPY